MKNKFFRRTAVPTAVLLSFTCVSTTAYAQSSEPVAKTKSDEEINDNILDSIFEQPSALAAFKKIGEKDYNGSTPTISIR